MAIGIYNLELCNTGGNVEVLIDGPASNGDVYSFSGSNEMIMCGTVSGLAESEIAYYTGITEYSGGCAECFTENTIEANPEYVLCVFDCSGNTVTLDLPHPVWTNNYGMNVVQMNAVALGGIDGLNN
jgi:hypothetical protein